MKTQVVARFMKSDSDLGLKIINGILYGPVHEYKNACINEGEMNKLIDEFIMLHPNESYWELSIEPVIE